MYERMRALLTTLGQFEEAMAYYHDAIKYDPKHAESYCNIGVIHKRLGNLRV